MSITNVIAGAAPGDFRTEFEEEFASAPPGAGVWAKPAGPGRGEIKLHNVRGIRAGLHQLRVTHEALTKRPPKTMPHFILITYSYDEPPPGQDYQFRVHVLVPHATIVSGAAPIPTLGRGPAAEATWLTSLGTWTKLAPDQAAPTWQMVKWRRLVGPGVFGSMVEPVIRSRFQTGGTKAPNQFGSDVRWQKEIAEYLAELHAELAGL